MLRCAAVRAGYCGIRALLNVRLELAEFALPLAPVRMVGTVHGQRQNLAARSVVNEHIFLRIEPGVVYWTFGESQVTRAAVEAGLAEAMSTLGLDRISEGHQAHGAGVLPL